MSNAAPAASVHQSQAHRAEPRQTQAGQAASGQTRSDRAGSDPVRSNPARSNPTRPNPTLPSKVIKSRFDSDDFFGHQRAERSALPNPAPLVENLARCVIEILAGARDLEQISRWVSDDVYRHLLKRVVLSARARQAKGQRVVSRPNFTIGSTSVTEPSDAVVEAVVIVHNRARSRAVAIRLEGMDSRWRATAINVL